jgi:hypothetical protein
VKSRTKSHECLLAITEHVRQECWKGGKKSYFGLKDGEVGGDDPETVSPESQIPLESHHRHSFRRSEIFITTRIHQLLSLTLPCNANHPHLNSTLLKAINTVKLRKYPQLSPIV